ncbi:hypothetical protein HO173_009407 [Letharia columbiana]|uniref:O-methyltransferase n=1 Tax=Letharia columbiana TaxID=112416 RepID=A0A8H6FPG9_9LECA|nr:uncharacterized protein HO173_009407 [Letharia columbiana]KAF6232302.1 hypothetical protein HO173_009407 [Letharia columbiana]
MLSSEVLSLIDQVNSGAKACQDENQNRDAQAELLATCRKLTAELESPFEAIRRFSFQPYETLALRIAIQLNLLDAIKDEDVTALGLATTTGADRLLIVRIMRVLCTMGVFTEKGVELYGAGRIALALRARPSLRDNVTTLFDFGLNAAAKLPSFLEKTSFANPTRDGSGLWQHAFNTPLDFWAWLEQDPERARAFHSSMVDRRHASADAAWFENYPVVANLCSTVPPASAEVLLVDVGGGWGQDLLAFASAHPSVPGRLILQDRAHALAEADRESLGRRRVEAIAHDFFDPQPVIGARAYYFHHIFHDWPDAECRTILQHTVAAMHPGGRSRLLIVEDVLPDVGVSSYLGLRDMHMMTLFGSMERNRGQWTELLGQEGLEVVKIWELGPKSESLIEAVLRQ